MSRTAEYMTRRQAEAWRERVAGYLAASTGREIRPRAQHARISDEIGDTSGDVVGVDGLTIRTASARSMRLSESLDAAEWLAAERADDSLGVVVQARHGRETPEAYVVLSLESLAALIRRSAPRGTR